MQGAELLEAIRRTLKLSGRIAREKGRFIWRRNEFYEVVLERSVRASIITLARAAERWQSTENEDREYRKALKLSNDLADVAGDAKTGRR